MQPDPLNPDPATSEPPPEPPPTGLGALPAEPPPGVLTQVAMILAAGYALHLLVEALAAVLAPLGIGRRAILAAVRLLKYARPPRPAGEGTAGRSVAAAAVTFQASYLVAAARRISAGLDSENPGRAVRAERRYLRQHSAAQQHRNDAAREVDQAAALSERLGAGRRFMWDSASEGGVCPLIGGRTCSQLNRTIWLVSAPPDGTWPGIRHYGCKCRALPAPPSALYRPQPSLRFRG